MNLSPMSPPTPPAPRIVVRPRHRGAMLLALPALLALVASVLLLSGCSTPRPARELAAQGAAMTDRSESETLAYIQRATQAYQRREAIVRRLAEGEIRDRAAGDFRAWIDAQAGVAGHQKEIDTITRIAERSRSAREQTAAALAAKTQQLAEAAGAPVKPPTAALAEAKQGFIVLSQELSTAEWLKLGQAYARQVQTDLKALNAPAPAASTPAGPPASAPH